MEKRKVEVSLAKAREWYKSGNKALKEVALHAFTEEELEGEYDKFAAQYGMEKDKIKEVVSAEGLKKDMLVEKAIKFVRDNAKVTTARKPKAKKEEAAESAE